MVYFLCLPQLAYSRECPNVLDQQIPPQDFSTAPKGAIESVEKRHFTRKVEMLISGESASIVADLHYTLNKFPNHYRALISLSNYDLQLKELTTSRQNEKLLKVDCYFKRAIQFRPKDEKVRQVYGIYMYKNKRFQEALESFFVAEKLGNNAEIEYHIGLTYNALEDMDKAKDYAIRAYAKGYPLQGLKNKLLTKGVKLD